MEPIPNEDHDQMTVEDEQNAAEANGKVMTEADILQVIAERDSYLDQLQRSLAEFANYRRRVEQDRVNARRIATSDLLSSVVPIADDFHRALEAIPADQSEAPWVMGVTLIERNLSNVLDREGVSKIDALGQPFDPSIHEAVAVEPGSSGTTVTEVYQNGYRHGDTLLRPAIVRVGDPESGEE